MSPSATELIIHGGVIPRLGISADIDATAVEARPSAVAVKQGRITEVGDESLLDLAGKGTRVINAQGGAILPGLNDGHLHFAGSAMIRHGHLSLKDAVNWQHVAALLESAEPDASGWIRAAEWDEAKLGNQGSELLFTAKRNCPVVAFDTSGHQVMVNETGLQRLGLDSEDVQVPGGVVGRNADGSLSGRFTDAAMRLVNDALPTFKDHQLRAAFVAHQRELHEMGLTSLTEPGLGPGGQTLMAASCGTESLHILAKMAREGELSLRINTLLLFGGTGGESLESVKKGLSSGLLDVSSGIDPLRLRIAGIKVFADGIPRSGTAWFHDEYRLPCGHGHGSLVLNGKNDEQRVTEFRAIMAAIDAAGLQAGVHVTGDAATEALLEAVESLPDLQKARQNRHYIIHGAFRSLDLLPRLHAAGMGYSSNPAIRAEAGALMRTLLGTQRFAEQQPLASAAKIGIPATLASDAPVTSPDWRNSVIAAVTRNTSAGSGDGEQERLNLAQALAMMTETPARQDHAEEHKGRIAPGYLADLCILRDPLSKDIEELATNATTYTIVNGDVVFSNDTAN